MGQPSGFLSRLRCLEHSVFHAQSLSVARHLDCSPLGLRLRQRMHSVRSHPVSLAAREVPITGRRAIRELETKLLKAGYLNCRTRPAALISYALWGKIIPIFTISYTFHDPRMNEFPHPGPALIATFATSVLDSRIRRTRPRGSGANGEQGCSAVSIVSPRVFATAV